MSAIDINGFIAFPNPEFCMYVTFNFFVLRYWPIEIPMAEPSLTEIMFFTLFDFNSFKKNFKTLSGTPEKKNIIFYKKILKDLLL